MVSWWFIFQSNLQPVLFWDKVRMFDTQERRHNRNINNHLDTIWLFDIDLVLLIPAYSIILVYFIPLVYNYYILFYSASLRRAQKETFHSKAYTRCFRVYVTNTIWFDLPWFTLNNFHKNVAILDNAANQTISMYFNTQANQVKSFTTGSPGYDPDI